MHNLKELKIWNKSIDLATEVYRLTANFPKEEKYGLTSQIRRSAVSVPSNIAEGAGRNTSGEFNHFLGISNGSAYELQTQLIISKNLELIDGRVDQVLDELDQIQKMISRYKINLLKSKSHYSILFSHILYGNNSRSN